MDEMDVDRPNDAFITNGKHSNQPAVQEQEMRMDAQTECRLVRSLALQGKERSAAVNRGAFLIKGYLQGERPLTVVMC